MSTVFSSPSPGFHEDDEATKAAKEQECNDTDIWAAALVVLRSSTLPFSQHARAFVDEVGRYGDIARLKKRIDEAADFATDFTPDFKERIYMEVQRRKVIRRLK